MAYHRLARSLAAPDRRGGLLDLRSAARALWQPQRLADGAAEPPTPDFQAAVRCRTVLSLYRSLCWTGPPPQVWPQGGLYAYAGAVPHLKHRGKSDPSLFSPVETVS